jgi:hypothetical protein
LPIVNRQRRHRGADPDVVPLDLHARHDLVDHREDGRHEREADAKLTTCSRTSQPPKSGAHHPAERGQRGADDQRRDQQEADAEDHPEREEAGAQQVPEPGALARRRPPDAVEGVLQLAEHGRRADQQHDNPEQRRENPLARLVDALEQTFDRLRGIGPIKPWSCETISPRAASSPNTRPAIEMTISSSGATEKTV